MWIRPAIAVICLVSAISAACAEDFRIEEATTASDWNVAQIKPGTVVFSDRADGAKAADDAALVPFKQWAQSHPLQTKFLAPYPGYSEPIQPKANQPKANARKSPVTQKLYMYVAQARFILDQPPATIGLARYVTLPFLGKTDPAIKHKVITAADLPQHKDAQAAGNDNPQRPWCTGRATLICIESSYALEGRIPLGIMLANKLRDRAKKISDHIDFESELSLLAPSDIDQAALQQLTALDTAVVGALEQNIFYVNQIMKFGKFFAVVQDHPTDPGKTVVTAYMALAIEASVLEKKRKFEKVPVLRNLVPEEVLMGKSSFNSGASISAGLPKYARNEIKTVAGLLQQEK